ncbi:hypothetical protein QE109_06150 [Fusibacter bizertensis]|jgi:hypothetical protein|uniref:DUF2812 domain-containing protein n=1 Tax=Fusibacter bizertensis TaxID=1488331 RepID=A0ABT6NBB9_9FIRM|nr:hypothetical protein [Fusibacter bizertensis]MDH8677719.1 hypothetical protein [Fusibacter bizertensis]
MKRLRKYYQDIYKYEEADKSYVINVSLDAYEDVYDEWDASPFKKRDIEDEFDDFIRDSSSDIPLKYGLFIDLFLPQGEYSEKKEKMLIEAYENFYQFKFRRELKIKQGLHRKVINYLVLAIIFLFFGYFYSPSMENIFLKIVKEGIFIGGWVFLWEVFTLLFITIFEENREVRMIKRLLLAQLRFIYR